MQPSTPHSETLQVRCRSHAFHRFASKGACPTFHPRQQWLDPLLRLVLYFKQCLDNLRGLLQELEKHQNILPEEDSASPHLLIQAIDQYGRLRIWTHDFRADLPDRSRSSLGDRLWLDHELRGNVLSIVS